MHVLFLHTKSNPSQTYHNSHNNTSSPQGKSKIFLSLCQTYCMFISSFGGVGLYLACDEANSLLQYGLLLVQEGIADELIHKVQEALQLICMICM